MKFRAKISPNIRNSCFILVLEHLTSLNDPDFFLKRQSGLYLKDVNSVAKALALIGRNLATFQPILLKILRCCSKPLLLRSTKDRLLYQTDVRSLFSQLGHLLEFASNDIHRSVLRAVKFHLTNSNHFIVSCIESSSFIEELWAVMRFPAFGEARPEALVIFRLLADKCTSALVQSLENANLSVLCTDVPDESVLLVNETLSVLLLRCLGSGLKVKGGEEEGDEGVGRSLLDFLIYRVPQHLHAQDGLSPSRKILYQKAAIANLLALLSTVSEESTKLARGDVGALSHHLTALVKLKHKSEEHLDLLSGYLGVFSTLDGEEASKVLLGIAADVVQPAAVRKEASFCLSRCLLKGQKGISDEKSIRSLFDGIGGYLQCARDCADLVGAAVHLCLAVVIGGSMFTHKKAVEVGVIEMVVSVLEKCLGCEDSSTDSTIFDGLLCLSRLCDGNTERCQRVGPSATHVLIVLLNRLQTQLCDQECPEITDWWDAERRMGSWPPLHRLVMCAVEAVQSCVANCCEDRRLFIQNGGITVLLNIMECIPPELSQPILRCVCKIHEHENAVKTELISWQGVRQRSAMPIDESLFEKPEVNLLTQEEELVLRMNEYRIGRQHPTENNLATHLCWLWRWNEERRRRDQKYAKSPQEWSPLMKYEDLYLLIYLLLSTLNFGKHFHLEADDQITMVDIENFPNAKENEVVQQIQADLRRCGVNPIIEDQDKLERAIQVSQTKAEQVMKKKMDIIKAAIACDTSQEAEFYTLPREIMRQRKAALQRDLDAQLRTSNYAYLCASRREKQRAINESRRRCQGGSCVTSTTIETSSLQCADTCSHLDDRHQMTKLDGRIESVVGLSEGNNLTGHQPASAVITRN